MRLGVGEQVGPFEVLELLDSGGMGEVYRARDRRLGREVALKILLDGGANEPARLARLEREARALAALNHPGIAAILEIQATGGDPVLVLELVGCRPQHHSHPGRGVVCLRNGDQK